MLLCPDSSKKTCVCVLFLLLPVMFFLPTKLYNSQSFCLISQPVLSRHVISTSLSLSLFPVCLCVQVPRAVTFLSTTCHRSSPTLRYCRCSCPSVTSSLPRCLLTAPPTRANASVSHVVKVVVTSVMVIVTLTDFLLVWQKTCFLCAYNDGFHSFSWM